MDRTPPHPTRGLLHRVSALAYIGGSAGCPSWEALTIDSGTSVVVLDTHGVVLYANSLAAEEVSRSAQEIVGHHISELFPAEFVGERLSFINKVVQTNRPLLVRTVMAGTLNEAVFRPIRGQHDDPPVVLITSRPVGDRSHAAEPPDAEVIDARFQDRGLLQKLTPRETEVLMLIGEGLSTADISKRLFRTIKTIEAHRASLGRKLGVSNRVQLARIALAAGLVQSAQRGGRAGESGEAPAEPVDADRSNGHATHVHAERVVRNNSQMA